MFTKDTSIGNFFDTIKEHHDKVFNHNMKLKQTNVDSKNSLKSIQRSPTVQPQQLLQEYSLHTYLQLYPTAKIMSKPPSTPTITTHYKKDHKKSCRLLTASWIVLTISGSSVVATLGVASPVAIAITLRAIFRPKREQTCQYSTRWKWCTNEFVADWHWSQLQRQRVCSSLLLKSTRAPINLWLIGTEINSSAKRPNSNLVHS